MKTKRCMRLIAATAWAVIAGACDKTPVTINEDGKQVTLCADPLFISLYNDGLVGNTSFSNSDTEFFVTIEAASGLLVKAATVTVFDCRTLDTASHASGELQEFAGTYTHAVAIAGLMGCKCVSGEVAFAEVNNLTATHIGSFMVEYCLSRCGVQDEPCSYRTQTQGGWGSKPSGNNPGAYLHEHFASAFPGGLTVGCNYTLTLTSAGAVTDFLPQGGTAAALTQNYVDPSGKLSVLAGQLVALTLSVGFDDADPSFGAGGTRLGDATVGKGPLSGKTVDELLTIGNRALGGCDTGYTLSDINEGLSMVNENYVDGDRDLGNVNCPR